jgi:hypothetical protein
MVFLAIVFWKRAIPARSNDAFRIDSLFNLGYGLPKIVVLFGDACHAIDIYPIGVKTVFFA